MANSSKMRRRLTDVYTFAEVRPHATVRGVFGNPQVRVITLIRRSKKRSAAAAAECIGDGTTDGYGACAISAVASGTSCWTSRFGASIAGVAAT